MGNSKLLTKDETKLVILPSLVKTLGLNEAILLQQVHYWLIKSKHDEAGYKWIYNSYPKWQKQFPWFSEVTIRRTIKGLEDKKILITGCFNRMKIDRTKWYRIDYLKLKELFPEVPWTDQASDQNEQMVCSKRADGSGQNDQTNNQETTQKITSDILTPTNKHSHVNVINEAATYGPEPEENPNLSHSITNLSIDKIIKVARTELEEPIKPLPFIVKLINKRLATFKEEDIIKAIQNRKHSLFYSGRNKDNWKADLPWIVKSDENLYQLLSIKNNDVTEDAKSPVEVEQVIPENLKPEAEKIITELSVTDIGKQFSKWLQEKPKRLIQYVGWNDFTRDFNREDWIEKHTEGGVNNG